MQFEGGKKTVCPFYLHESRHRISCESIIEDALDISLYFETEENKVGWQEDYCYSFSAYRYCPIVQMLEEYKYPEED